MVSGAMVTSDNSISQSQKAIISKMAQEAYYAKSFFKVVKMSDVKEGNLSAEDVRYPLLMDISEEFTKEGLKGKIIQIPRFGDYEVRLFTEGNNVQTSTVDWDFIELAVNTKPYTADKISKFQENFWNIPYRQGMAARMARALNNFVERQIMNLSVSASTKLGGGNGDLYTHEFFYDVYELFESRNIPDLDRYPPIVFINPKQKTGLLKQNDEWTKLGQLGVDYYMKGKIVGMIGGCAIAVSNNIPLDGNGGTNALAICGSQAIAAAVTAKPEMEEYYLPEKKAKQFDMMMEEGMNINDDRHLAWINKDADGV